MASAYKKWACDGYVSSNPLEQTSSVFTDFSYTILHAKMARDTQGIPEILLAELC
jgi:hypothetical protein